MNGLKSLLKSRKFWLAVVGVIQTIVLHYFEVPADIWAAVDVLIGVLIASIAYEDGQAKSSAVRTIYSGDEY